MDSFAMGVNCPPFPNPASRAASMVLRQAHFATIDLELHSRFTPGQVRCTALVLLPAVDSQISIK